MFLDDCPWVNSKYWGTVARLAKPEPEFEQYVFELYDGTQFMLHTSWWDFPNEDNANFQWLSGDHEYEAFKRRRDAIFRHMFRPKPVEIPRPPREF